MSDKLILCLIVLAGIVVRVVFLWVGRPEFVGWFNHTYYYYVEVKGLLEDGMLPYPDMPLLFYLYAFSAKGLIWTGGAYLFSRKGTKIIGMYGGILLIAAAGAVVIFYLFDEQRAERVFFYLGSSYGASFLGQLFSAESNTTQKLEAILSILIPILITLLSWRLFRIRKAEVSEENRLFWLSNIIFSYLLILPVYDQLLFGRFALFLSLPSLFILGFVINFSISKTWQKQLVLALVVLGILVPGFGEFMSLKFHNRDKGAVFAELMKAKEIG